MACMRITRAAFTVLICAVLIAAAGCKDAENIQIDGIKSGTRLAQLKTDKARYAPGEEVKLEADLQQKAENGRLIIRYKHLADTLKEEKLEVSGDKIDWSWTPPAEDEQGYMVEVFFKQDGEIVDHMNIGVDISNDWGKFPRYGYLADFPKMEPSERAAVIERLNRFHINGIQFYDWQWKHHIPLKTEGGKPVAVWPDIANRTTSLETIRDYIDLSHEKNMKAMNYNLLFGAYAHAEEDGVKKEWGLYRDPLHKQQDFHPLPDSWASNIYLQNPANEQWQQYLFAQEKKVFAALPFDGWHVDQLGDRGARWDYEGKKADLAMNYGPFLQSAKESIDVDYVMNAVAQYGQAFIATQAPVKFLYTEVWAGHPSYRNLKDIIDQNGKFSKGKLNTVLAAYMNYNLANSRGKFNTPGVVITNAVIFASGGSHLELGENMLSKEYFPNNNLTIPDELNDKLIDYYDYLVAYENLLRDDAEEQELELTASSGQQLSATGEIGKIWTFAKKQDNKDILHFLNLTDATTVQWNDTLGTQAEPSVQEDLSFTMPLPAADKVKKLWTASPDRYDGSPVELKFEHKGGKLSFTMPQLQYWDMVVIEYEQK